jgi:hypothetical protein
MHLIPQMQKRDNMSKDRVSSDEHIIVCSECGRALIVRDIVNNGVAFLSHLKIDHGITFTPQLMTEAKTERKKSTEKQLYKTDN